METRSGTMPQTGTLSSVHHSTVASRSLVPSRAEQMTTPAGTLRGVMARVARTRVGSTPPARVGITTASARPSAACTREPSPGGVSTTTRPYSCCIALVTVRTEGPSTSSTPSMGSVSYHSAVAPWGSASTRTTGSRPRRAAAAARYTAVVVLPTPPLTLLTTRFIAFRSSAARGDGPPHGIGRRKPHGRPARSPLRQHQRAEPAPRDEHPGDHHDHEIGDVRQQDRRPDPEVGRPHQHHPLVQRGATHDQLEPDRVHGDRVEGGREQEQRYEGERDHVEVLPAPHVGRAGHPRGGEGQADQDGRRPPQPGPGRDW